MDCSSAAAAGRRRATLLAVALWSLLLPACRSLSLERGRLQEADSVLGRQQPSPEGHLGDFGEFRLGRSSASAEAERWANSLRGARASSLQTIARILNSTGPDQPPLTIRQVCASFGLEEGSCERVHTYLGKVAYLPTRTVAKVKRLATSVVKEQAIAITLRDFGCNSDSIQGHLLSIYMGDFCKAVDASAAADGGNGRSALDERVVVLYAGDWGQRRSFCFPTLIKTRHMPDDAGNSVLLDLNHGRHWKPVAEVGGSDSPLSDKLEELVWRGASTGECSPSAEGSRMMLVSKYFNHDPRIDVGINMIVQDCVAAAQYYKKRMTMQQLLQRKYILVVNGNDKASSLNWILASNSVPFMTEPIVESWLMESSLKAWVHYVPVNPDFSNLVARLDWAQANPAKMSEIAEAGKRHIQRFADPKTEADIEGAVLAAYLDRVDVVSGGPGSADGVDADAQC